MAAAAKTVMKDWLVTASLPKLQVVLEHAVRAVNGTSGCREKLHGFSSEGCQGDVCPRTGAGK